MGWYPERLAALEQGKAAAADLDALGDCPTPTLACNHRLGIVTVGEIDYRTVDIGMRMLTPRELFRAQGSPDDYVIAPLYNGRPLTKTAQIRMCGNSVCPDAAEALVRANIAALDSNRVTA